MKNKKIYLDKQLIICITLLFIVSILSINSAIKLLPSYQNTLVLKQILWYLIGIVIASFIMYIGNDKLFNNIKYLYWFGIILLIGLFFFAPTINDAKCWYYIPGIGSIQPSEFMKIILILVLAQMINKFHNKIPNPTTKEEFLFLCKVGIVIFIPSILTFLQPDTGVVLIYLLITLTMLFISGIRYRWFLILVVILGLLLSLILIFYFFFQDTFIEIFGSSLFLRIDRILNWSNSSGYQLEQGRTAIGAAGLWGYGFNNTPLYFPEPQTDFIFAVYASNSGFIGVIMLLLIMGYLDLRLIRLAKETKKYLNKYIIAGSLGMLIYQQIQNIGMTIGLLPITGITLPFISYGGSSLLSYFMILGIVCNIVNENQYKNK